MLVVKLTSHMFYGVGIVMVHQVSCLLGLSKCRLLVWLSVTMVGVKVRFRWRVNVIDVLLRFFEWLMDIFLDHWICLCLDRAVRVEALYFAIREVTEQGKVIVNILSTFRVNFLLHWPLEDTAIIARHVRTEGSALQRSIP